MKMKSFKYIYSTENGIRKRTLNLILYLKKKKATPTRFEPVSLMNKQNEDNLVFANHWARWTFLPLTFIRFI